MNKIYKVSRRLPDRVFRMPEIEEVEVERVTARSYFYYSTSEGSIVERRLTTKEERAFGSKALAERYIASLLKRREELIESEYKKVKKDLQILKNLIEKL